MTERPMSRRRWSWHMVWRHFLPRPWRRPETAIVRVVYLDEMSPVLAIEYVCPCGNVRTDLK